MVVLDDLVETFNSLRGGSKFYHEEESRNVKKYSMLTTVCFLIFLIMGL